ncbi:FBP domain-containing protein [Gulosibacter sediminis]|uniref:FBP domain-containing protein n=1 Tax=Gulosibacter sediminis TaxID=1729695 RepID=UPI0024AC95AE|nr:FBP domain-containing protein [Gulosibacter sediminis]
MIPLTEKFIRTNFINASKKERSELSLPENFDEVDWDSLDYFGWRDPRVARRAYAFVPIGGDEVRGILFQQQPPLAKPQLCGWCHDVRLPNDVVFSNAKRSGSSGRNGNTVAVYVCKNFECSFNVRNDPPSPYDGFDMDAARTSRIEGLRERAAKFAAEL